MLPSWIDFKISRSPDIEHSTSWFVWWIPWHSWTHLQLVQSHLTVLSVFKMTYCCSKYWCVYPPLHFPRAMACSWSTRWSSPTASLSGRSISPQTSSVRVITQEDEPAALSAANNGHWTEQSPIMKEWLKQANGDTSTDVAHVASKWNIAPSVMFLFSLSSLNLVPN